MNSQVVAKIVFLVFVVVIAGYIMFNNKTGSLEGFADAAPTSASASPASPTTLKIDDKKKDAPKDKKEKGSGAL
jgi:hypothetical protein